MLRTAKAAKTKQLRPQLRTIAFTTLWLVVLGAALAFMAFAGHI